MKTHTVSGVGHLDIDYETEQLRFGRSSGPEHTHDLAALLGAAGVETIYPRDREANTKAYRITVTVTAEELSPEECAAYWSAM